MSIPADCRFSKEHEWAKEVDGGNIRVGISDYAQQELGDVVFVELPEVGAEFKVGESFANVESVKAVSDVYAPVDGVVAAVNTNLVDQAQLINEAPHEGGWMIEITPSDAGQLEALMDSATYQGHLDEISK